MNNFALLIYNIPIHVLGILANIMSLTLSIPNAFTNDLNVLIVELYEARNKKILEGKNKKQEAGNV